MRCEVKFGGAVNVGPLQSTEKGGDAGSCFFFGIGLLPGRVRLHPLEPQRGRALDRSFLTHERKGE